mmetsp:Transcript_4855/g.12188  ORF Transcript_4855/g.12188 Transcript_4855/m.12188 type:complete len:229 (-) Transcript_4855:1039-1725(-)
MTAWPSCPVMVMAWADDGPLRISSIVCTEYIRLNFSSILPSVCMWMQDKEAAPTKLMPGDDDHISFVVRLVDEVCCIWREASLGASALGGRSGCFSLSVISSSSRCSDAPALSASSNSYTVPPSLLAPPRLLSVLQFLACFLVLLSNFFRALSTMYDSISTNSIPMVNSPRSYVRRSFVAGVVGMRTKSLPGLTFVLFMMGDASLDENDRPCRIRTGGWITAAGGGSL